MPDSERLSEDYVQDSFHSYLKSSLTQAKVERLLDVDMLSSAEGDLMITGPALCLYFAALRCTTNPPSVPLPRVNKTTPPLQLTGDNCPRPFIAFLNVWANAVPEIQNLAPEHQHDLARLICGLPPLAQPTNSNLSRIAADLRAVAIEISQRRSFQERYSTDLQAAIDAGEGPSGSRHKVKASFSPPPAYDPSAPKSSHSSPRSDPGDLPSKIPSYAHVRTHSTTSNGYLSPTNSEFIDPKSPVPRPPSPSILTAHSPAIELIRETLYASLADVLERVPSIRRVLHTDPPRAYFAAVSFAILDVATTCVMPDGAVQGVLGQQLTLVDCPQGLRPFMIELAGIGAAAREMEEQDDDAAVQIAAQGGEVPVPRLERVRWMLEKGVGHHLRDEGDAGRRSVEGRAVAFANRINGLALGLTRLKAFRERQGEVFKVLSGVGT
ncbi:hypothetical protein NEOLEDRAFT_1138274 [Neolentinus lepideus HHB14362 ss-1]|uniref:Uncharacterized protein n=1 Tax=Neolentinus lepideus HHB14362 ss-1 TaxID=1314782 RepID=A0A165QAZ7_9AGAM|nr:hypothetical protein NEOLEDRAFT_1138274 [Neolentinus lepideus HHB14362 ss-1]